MASKIKKETVKAKKGDKYVCEECGFTLVVDEPCRCHGECVMVCDRTPMKLVLQ